MKSFDAFAAARYFATGVICIFSFYTHFILDEVGITIFFILQMQEQAYRSQITYPVMKGHVEFEANACRVLKHFALTLHAQTVHLQLSNVKCRCMCRTHAFVLR